MRDKRPFFVAKENLMLGGLGVTAIMAAVMSLGNAQADTVFNLGTIVIRGGVETSELLDESVISQQQMQQFNTHDVGRAINWLPGTTISAGGPRNEQTIYFLSKTALNENHDIKVRAYHDEYKNGLDMYKDSSFTQHDPTSAYKDTTYGGAIEWVSRQLTDHELHVALHYKLDRHQDEGVLYKDRTMSLAVEDLIYVQDDWRLRVGVSHERRKSLEAAHWPKGSGSATNGVIELLYDLTDTTELHASIAYKTRFPTIKDRYSARMGRALPSPDLKSENARHFEFGGRTQPWAGAQFDGALFYSQVQDMIDTVSVLSNACPNNNFSGYCDQAQNVGKVRRYGLELNYQQKLTEQWSAGINYTYLHNKNHYKPKQKIRDIPNHKVMAFVNWAPNEQWQVQATMEAESGRYYSYIAKGQELYTKTSGFAIWGLKTQWSPRHDLSFEAGVRNLGDKNYEYKEGYPMAGRVWFAGATYRF